MVNRFKKYSLKMDVPRYLLFDIDNEYVRLTSLKFPEDHLVIHGKDVSDIRSFSPKTVLCFQNKKIIEECEKLKINCVYLYTEKIHKVKQNDNLSTVLIKPFDLQKIRENNSDDTLSFSMLSETTTDISNLMSNFKNGSNIFINPGSIKLSDILQYYGIKNKKLIEGQDRRPQPVTNQNNSKINTFFEDEKRLVNIYLPTYHRLNKTKKSLNSILEDIKLSNYDVEVYIGDNSPNFPELREWLKTLESEKVHVHLGEKNIGKSGMVNYLYQNSRKCDYLFSIDSDMIPIKDSNFVDNMIYHLTRLDNCGIVSSNQLECSQHWFGTSVDTIEVNGIKVGFSPGGVGIAGGCIVLRSEDWERIGMYKENHDIYTGDDGILTYNMGKILGKYVYISVNCSLIHPSPEESEKDYVEWKTNSWKRDQLKFLDDSYKGENKKGFYD